MGHLVGANKTLINHFADIGNMVVMKSQFVTSPDVIPQIQTNMQLLKNNEGQQNTPADNQFAQTIVTQMIPELMKNPESLKLIMEMSKEQKK